MVHHRKKTPGGCLERFARSGSCRDSIRGSVRAMNSVQSGRRQA